MSHISTKMTKNIEKLAEYGEILLIKEMEEYLKKTEENVNEFVAPLRNIISRGISKSKVIEDMEEYLHIQKKFEECELDFSKYQEKFNDLRNKYESFKI